MAEKLVTPVDKLTGLPPPIAPMQEWLPLDDSEVADVHHAVHPRKSPLLKSLAGQALTGCRLQVIERGLHNRGPLRYHGRYKGPLDLPQSEDETFSTVISGVAGALSEDVIDLSTSEPFTRPATTREAKFLRTIVVGSPHKYNYRYITYDYWPVQAFAGDFAIRQDISHVDKKITEEFTFTQDDSKKLVLGHMLLLECIEVAAKVVKDKYSALQEAGMLHPFAPPRPETVIRHMLGNQEQRAELIPDLGVVLKRQYCDELNENLAA